MHTGHKYFVFGKPGFFLGKPQMAHPDLENFNTGSSTGKAWMEPVYPTTEKLRAKYLTGQSLAKFTKELMAKLSVNDINENLPDEILVKYKFVPRFLAYRQIHFPANEEQYKQALRRLKFEELFFAQLRLGQIRLQRHVLQQVSSL